LFGYLSAYVIPQVGSIMRKVPFAATSTPKAFRSSGLLQDLIRSAAPNKSFVDIGALWGVHGLYAFLAEEAGATRVVAVDVYPATDEFSAEHARRESLVEFVQGDVTRSETIRQIRPCDVVFCSGVLYHTPNPVHLLASLRSICNETLILDTAVVPEMRDLSHIAVFYPFLPKSERKLWSRGRGIRLGLTTPYEPRQGYGNWFWGMSPSCVEAMLKCAGFETVKKYVNPLGGACFVARATASGFLPVSGDWLPRETEAGVNIV